MVIDNIPPHNVLPTHAPENPCLLVPRPACHPLGPAHPFFPSSRPCCLAPHSAPPDVHLLPHFRDPDIRLRIHERVGTLGRRREGGDAAFEIDRLVEIDHRDRLPEAAVRCARCVDQAARVGHGTRGVRGPAALWVKYCRWLKSAGVIGARSRASTALGSIAHLETVGNLDHF